MKNNDVPQLSSNIRNWLILLLGIFIVFCVLAPNLTWITSPFTPFVHGKIIDTNSGKPIKQMRILISHHIRYVYIPGNGYTNYSKSFIVNTDNNGEFTIERTIKPISFTLFGVFDREYDGSYLITLDNKYKYMSDKIPLDGNIILYANTVSNIGDMRKNYKIYDLIEKDNYPTSIKQNLVVQAGVRLAIFELLC